MYSRCMLAAVIAMCVPLLYWLVGMVGALPQPALFSAPLLPPDPLLPPLAWPPLAWPPLDWPPLDWPPLAWPPLAWPPGPPNAPAIAEPEPLVPGAPDVAELLPPALAPPALAPAVIAGEPAIGMLPALPPSAPGLLEHADARQPATIRQDASSLSDCCFIFTPSLYARHGCG